MYGSNKDHRVLEVEYGSIYTKSRDVMIDNLVIIYDKQMGCVLKYGDADRSNIKKYYEHMVKKWRDIGMEEDAENIVMVEFDRYDGILSIEEICTLANYLIMVSALGDKFHRLLNSDEDTIKQEIARLQELGF